MNRLLMPVLAAIMLSALAGGVAAASNEGAHKQPLLRSAYKCTSGAVGGPQTESFAVINQPDKDVTAEVALKQAAADTTYQVFLVQTPSGAGCAKLAGTITTNTEGNAAVHVSQELAKGTSGAFVYVKGGGSVVATRNVTLG